MANRFNSAFKFSSIGSGFGNKKEPEVTSGLSEIKTITNAIWSSCRGGERWDLYSLSLV